MQLTPSFFVHIGDHSAATLRPVAESQATLSLFLPLALDYRPPGRFFDADEEFISRSSKPGSDALGGATLSAEYHGEDCCQRV